MNSLIVTWIALVGATLTGRSLLAMFDRVLGTRGQNRPWAEVWGLSILLGMGFTAAAAFVWSDMGYPLNTAFAWRQALIGSLLGIVATIQGQRYRLGSITTSVLPTAPTATPLARVCQVGLGMLITAALIQPLLTPQKYWDERAIFALKANVLFASGSIDAPDLMNPDFVQSQPRSPLMLPLLERHVYALNGAVADRWPKLWFPLMFTGLLLSFAGVLTRRSSPDWGWLMTLLLALVPVLMPYEYGFLSAQADAPMACFHGVAVLFLWDALQEVPGPSRRRGILLASSLAATACFIKDEGLADLVVDALAWGIAVFLGGGRMNAELSGEGRFGNLSRHLLGITLFVGFAAILLIPWMRHRATLPTTTEMHYLERMDARRILERLSTLRWSLPHLIQRMFLEWRAWGLPWWMLVLAILTAPRRSWAGPQRFLLLNLLGTLAAFVIAGLFAPAELKGHLGGSSHRDLMQLVPVAVLFVAAVWMPLDAQPQSSSHSRTASPSPQ